MLSYLKVPIGWKDLFKRTFDQALEDDVMGLAAQLAYYLFLALFPALLFLVALASYFPLHNLMDEIVSGLRGMAPPDVLTIITDQLAEISNSRNGGLLTVGFLFTLWSTSSGMAALINTLNKAYDIEEGRPWWKVRLIAVALTVATGLFVLISFALVVMGPALAGQVADWFGLGRAFEITWLIVQWPIVFFLVVTGIGLIYYWAPDAEQQWVWITPGSLFATLLWLVGSLGFRFYVTNFGSYNETYGAIGGVIVALLWIWLSGLAILMGAELNAEIEHVSEYGKEPGEKRPGERKKIGALAAQAYEEARREGRRPAPSFVPTASPVSGAWNGLNRRRGERRRPAPPRPPRPSMGELALGGMALAAQLLSVIRSRFRRKLPG